MARDGTALVLVAALMAFLDTGGARAQSAPAEASRNESATVADEIFAIHGQATYVEQNDDGFRAPYAGANSLTPSRGRETADATLYLGARPWHGAEVWITPEIDQGFGLDDTLGVAGFPSGEAYKVGAKRPYLRWPRAFVRQTLDTGEARESLNGVANQLGGSRSLDRWVFTIGKFGVTDIFDTNQYSHDPRSDFLNWSAIDGGAFDYAADAWGFTVGAAAERYSETWTFRGGVFDLSTIPNSVHLDPGFHEFQLDAEIEKRYRLWGQTGRVLLTAFDSRGRMALLDETLAITAAPGVATPGVATPGVPINTALLRARQYRGRLGGVLGLEQPLTNSLGVFARVSKAAGNVEPYEFTDIDRSLSVGMSVQGVSWHRPEDSVGLVGIDNGISAEREAYLNAGGLGILIGDGKLPHPRAEQILETYYRVAVIASTQVSLDYQWVKNPAYNSDRGPVSIVALRVHVQF